MYDNSKNSEYLSGITEAVRRSGFYPEFSKSIKSGKSSLKFTKRRSEKKFDFEWVEAIEDCIVSLDTIVRNPRKFIIIEEDIIDISLAKSITTDSVKHLAQHTNLISSVNEQGMVLPNKILNTSKEESYEIYENRFIYTLLIKLRDFINKRFDLIKKAYAEGTDSLRLSLNSQFSLGKTNMLYSLDMVSALPPEEGAGQDLSGFERVEKLNRIVGDFLGSAFAKQMVSSAPVRPPIQRTNCILKNNDFKKALVLWQFIETYEKTGFDSEVKEENAEIPAEAGEKLHDAESLNALIFSAFAPQGGSAAPLNDYKKANEIGFSEAKEEIKSNAEPEKTEKDDSGEKQLSKDKQEDKALSEQESGELEELPQIPEILNIFEKNPETAFAKPSDIKKINLAIDRVILSIKIAEAKEKEALLKKLREKEKKEEEKQKKFAEAEKKALEKKNAAEIRRERLLREKENKEKLRLEKLEEKRRLEEIKAKELEEAASAARIAEAEKARQEHIERIRAEIEKIDLDFKEKTEKLKLESRHKAVAYGLEKAKAVEKTNSEKEENISALREKTRVYIQSLVTEQKKRVAAYKSQFEKDEFLYMYLERLLGDMKKKSAALNEAIKAVEKTMEEII